LTRDQQGEQGHNLEKAKQKERGEKRRKEEDRDSLGTERQKIGDKADERVRCVSEKMRLGCKRKTGSRIIKREGKSCILKKGRGLRERM